MVTATWSGVAQSFAVLVHGGAGTIKEASRASREAGCRAAAEAARLVLKAGGRALDAVQRAVELLEDDPQFNAGTGGSLTRDGHLELDAAIMQGRGLRAGAVCALPAFKNPIAIARRVLEEGKHVLYAAHGAEAIARQQGFEPAVEEEMITAWARERLAQALAGDPAGAAAGHTVGAVALDRDGDVAAATSTGGITGKAPGRVGDSPLLGAGTYADAAFGAASATGHGEGIVRVALTFRALASLNERTPPDAAARAALELMEREVGSRGGLVIVALDGRLGLARTSPAMPWAAAWDDASAISAS